MVLALLIHLGYPAYDEETGKAHVPNEEINREFARTIRSAKCENEKKEEYPEGASDR